jgi:MoxR-like ATPase
MTNIDSARADLERLQKAREQILSQLSRTIVGQTDVVEQLLICIFARGHCLFEGVPGLAKT